MDTYSVTAPDGVRIVYDVAGTGPAIILLHGGGGGQTRRSWHQSGYVARLQDSFKVITMDIRGHGESGKPSDPASYTIDRMCQDILLVADACRVEQFVLWGFSYGGNIGRFLATRSERVTKLIIMGIPFGLAAPGAFRQFIHDFRARWEPIVQAQRERTLDLSSLSDEDREVLQRENIPALLAWLTAMLDWGHNEPGDLRCPTLWLAGSKNEPTMASMEEHEGLLADTTVQPNVVKGITHMQEFEEIDLVFPIMLDFTNAGD